MVSLLALTLGMESRLAPMNQLLQAWPPHATALAQAAGEAQGFGWYLLDHAPRAGMALEAALHAHALICLFAPCLGVPPVRVCAHKGESFRIGPQPFCCLDAHRSLVPLVCLCHVQLLQFLAL